MQLKHKEGEGEETFVSSFSGYVQAHLLFCVTPWEEPSCIMKLHVTDSDWFKPIRGTILSIPTRDYQVSALDE